MVGRISIERIALDRGIYVQDVHRSIFLPELHDQNASREVDHVLPTDAVPGRHVPDVVVAHTGYVVRLSQIWVCKEFPMISVFTSRRLMNPPCW